MNTMARGFSIGGVLSTAFNLWTKNLGLYLGIALVFALPAMLIGLVSTSPLMNGLGGLVNSIFGMIGNGMVTFAIFEHLAGRAPSFNKLLSVGLARFGTILGVAILAGLIIGGGTLLLVVPGLILMCVLFVSVPVAVVENPGAVASLGRSATLTSGHRWEIFAMAILFGILAMGPAFILAMMLHGNLALATFAGSLVAVVIASLQSVAVVVAYRDLRVEKEGFDTATLTQVFG